MQREKWLSLDALRWIGSPEKERSREAYLAKRKEWQVRNRATARELMLNHYFRHADTRGEEGNRLYCLAAKEYLSRDGACFQCVASFRLRPFLVYFRKFKAQRSEATK